jgi:ATP-dependent RNA helicase DeaD
MKKHVDLPAGFAPLGIEVRFLKALAKMEFHTPTDIQREMIPLALAGRDLLGQARTGTGKTAAFGLPILQQIDPAGRLQGLCLTPTRELAVQVAAELRRLAEFADLHIVPVYGGQKIAHQVHLLGRKPHVVVATPGRYLDLVGRNYLHVDALRFVVLDEVDRMLDIGFRDDIKRILSQIRQPHQTILVSATIDREIDTLARQYMNDAVLVNVSRDEITVSEVEQFYCSVEAYDKFHMLRVLLRQEEPKLAIVFTNTKHQARKLAKKLFDAGVNAKEIHGDLVQQRREKVMERFRKHQIHFLVATDLAARGIDVTGVTHIINYDIPPDPHVYVHRIGRTARMGASGRAITFVTREQGKELTEVEKLINKEIPQLQFAAFVPRPPREEFVPPPRHVPAVATAPAVAAPTHGSLTLPPRRTLGSKFPVRRRRR